MNEIKYVFVTGVGRSGTTFLSNLLSNCSEAKTHHEYERSREFQLLSWYIGKSYAKPFLENQKKQIEKNSYGFNKFIDVNGGYRHCVDELEYVFSPIKIFHLVRNPKDVVRSLYTRRDDENIHFAPKQESEIKWWLEADKFSQICWNWKKDTEILLDKGLDLLHFEKIISDYDYFKNNLLDKIELKMDKSVWEDKVVIKKNKTRSKLYRFFFAKYKGKKFVGTRLPQYEEWSEDYKKKFTEICGGTMLKLGYE